MRSALIPILFGTPGWVLKGAAVDLDFANGRYYGGGLGAFLSLTRASSGTDLLPSSASGAAYTPYGSGALRINGNGLLIEESRTNQLLNSTAPATQTTASLGTGSYTLWVNGSGSALASAGTATITGASSATNGSPNTISVTVAGTVTITVTGSLNAFQLEAGASGTSLIVTAGATATRAADNIQATGALLSALQSPAVTIFARVGLLSLASAARIIGYNASSPTPAFTSNATLAGIFLNSVSTTATVGNSGNFKTGFVKQVTSYDSTGDSVVAQGGTESTSVNTIASVTSAQIGSVNALSNFLDGYLARLAVWNSRLPATMRLQFSQP